jgi:thiamine-monophosphate kinase
VELREIGEFGLIARIQDRLPDLPSSVFKGIGDDAGVASLTPGRDLVSTVDLLLEDVHFDLSVISPYLLGRKSLAVNLSDIAAMGGLPRFTLISMAVPPRIRVEFIDDFFRGFSEMAQAFGVSLIGGDTSSSPDRLFISVTLLGEGRKDALVYRNGARAGDDLYVTGTLGDSLMGLRLVQRTGRPTLAPEEKFLLSRHLNPTPRVKEGQALSEKGLATAMIDISDGLFSDLSHICTESRVGATIWTNRIPQSPALQKLVSASQSSGWQLALKGGEDYELLFAAPPGKESEIIALGRQWDCGVTRIGQVEPQTSGINILDENGPVDPELLKGYDHFARPSPPENS